MSGLVQIVIGGLLQGGVFAIVALGFSLVYRVTGAINLSQGGFALVAAMIGYSFAAAWGWPLLVAIPAVWAYNYFTNKVEAFDVEMDNSSMELINYFITRRSGKK